MICDEPTTLLDLYNVGIFLDTIGALSQQIILMTHHLEIIEDFDRVIVMERGQVHCDGSPREAVAAYRHLIGSRQKKNTHL
ncbi:Biotin transport ATP-binding protein BioM [compost metagenome]